MLPDFKIFYKIIVKKKKKKKKKSGASKYNELIKKRS